MDVFVHFDQGSFPIIYRFVQCFDPESAKIPQKTR